MDYEQKQREAFYLVKKYSSYTWYLEIFRLWKRFCINYEQDFYRKPVTAPAGDYKGAGEIYKPTDWDEANLKMFWAYARDMEEGLSLLISGTKTRAYESLSSGTRFGQWLFSRRFEEMDLSVFGYRRSPGHGIATGIFSDAQVAHDMAMADGIRYHTDELRRDHSNLPNKNHIEYWEPLARQLRIPYGIPAHPLEPVPPLDPRMPTVITGDKVPALGIWMVEPDQAHAEQTYCMAYLRPWTPAIDTISEQEYEINTRWIRTRDEKWRPYSDKVKDYPIRWRLLWHDTRYEDGRIPPEEAEYLIYREPKAEIKAPPECLRCEAGEPCPREGWWVSPASAGRRYFKQGETMPSGQTGWGKTIWQLEPDAQ